MNIEPIEAKQHEASANDPEFSCHLQTDRLTIVSDAETLQVHEVDIFADELHRSICHQCVNTTNVKRTDHSIVSILCVGCSYLIASARNPAFLHHSKTATNTIN